VTGMKVGFTLEGAKNGSTLLVVNSVNFPEDAIYYDGGDFGVEYLNGAYVLVQGFSLTAEEDGSTVTVSATAGYTPDLSYSTDGKQWTPVDLETPLTVTLEKAGDKVYFKGDNPSGLGRNETQYVTIDGTGKLSATGDATTLLDRAGSVSDLPDYAFYKLFEGNEGLVSAKKLLLPTQTLSAFCYDEMFANCTSLTETPELSALTLSVACYHGMFYGCSSLKTAPVLPAVNTSDYCYYEMFSGCTSLTSAPALNAEKTTLGCYACMFADCTSLTVAPALPATFISESCYDDMFYGCNNLLEAPALPGIVLDEYCYREMFSGCVKLQTTPVLPATYLYYGCYESMFKNCTSLKETSQIYATEGAADSMNSMFIGCNSLSVVRINLQNWDVKPSLWLYGVAMEGVFVCPETLPDERGDSRIPNGWVVAESTFTVWFNILNQIKSTAVGKPYGQEIAEYRLPTTVSLSIDRYRFAGWSYGMSGAIIEEEVISVSDDLVLYAVLSRVPYIYDEDGNELPESETNWYLGDDNVVHIVYSDVTLSEICGFPIKLENTCKTLTLDGFELTSYDGVGLILTEDTEISLAGISSINVTGSKTLGRTVTGIGIDANGKNVVFDGAGSLLLEVNTLSLNVRAGSIYVYGVQAKLFQAYGSGTISITAGLAENTAVIAENSYSVGVKADDVYVTSGKVIAKSYGAITAGNAYSYGVFTGDVSLTGGSLECSSGEVSEGLSASSAAIRGRLEGLTVMKATVEGANERNDSGTGFTQKEMDVPVAVYCVPKISVYRAYASDAVGYAKNPVFGKPVSSYELYTADVFNFDASMYLTLEYLSNGEWVVGTPAEVCTIFDSITDESVSVMVSTFEGTPAGEWLFRLTNGISGDNFAFAEFSVTVEKMPGVVPDDPDLLSKTDSSITVATIDGVEYSVDGENWRTSVVGRITFDELVGGETYAVYARSVETENVAASVPNTSLKVTVYTYIENLRALAVKDLEAYVGENYTEGIEEVFESVKREVNRCYNADAVNEAKNFGFSRIYLFSQKERTKRMIELAAGETPSDEMITVIRFAKTRIEAVIDINDLDAEYAVGVLDISQQHEKEAIDELVVDKENVSTALKACLVEVKRLIDSGTDMADVQARASEGRAKVVFRSEKDRIKAQVETLAKQEENRTTELVALVEKVKGEIDSAPDFDKLVELSTSAIARVSLRIEKDGIKAKLDELAGANLSRELKSFVEQQKTVVDAAEDEATLTATKATVITAVTGKKAEEELLSAKNSAKAEIYAYGYGAVSENVKSAMQGALDGIDSATTSEEVEQAKALGVQAIERQIAADARLPLWVIVMIIVFSFVILALVALIILKKTKFKKVIRRR
ncbi:MAG: leucine-rich repeat protein, partial [Clostridia bacterium]|nr:leucine-rich repeat protein [Clostridia bacterium]